MPIAAGPGPDVSTLSRLLQVLLAFAAFELLGRAIRVSCRSMQDRALASRLPPSLTALLFSTGAFATAAAVLLLDPTLHLDRLGAASSSITIPLMAFAAGYFLHDIVDCMGQDVLDVPFLVHHVICAGAYLYGLLAGRYHYYATCFLLYEGSTPFLNVQGILSKLGRPEHDRALVAARALFAATFFAIRIVFGTGLIGAIWRDLIVACRPDASGVATTAVLLLASGAFQVLNMYWMRIIIGKAIASSPSKHRDGSAADSTTARSGRPKSQ